MSFFSNENKSEKSKKKNLRIFFKSKKEKESILECKISCLISLKIIFFYFCTPVKKQKQKNEN